MPASNKTMIHKLQTAINQNGGKILINTIQFFSEEQNRPITLYKICEPGKVKGSRRRMLFDTPSQLQVVLFLRDYWYNMNNMEIPTDNPEWEEVKKKKGTKRNLPRAVAKAP